MDVTSPAPPRARVITESVSLGEVDPGTFLRRHHGLPRGFWADRRGWAAHAGAIQWIRGDDGDVGAAAQRTAEALGLPGSDLRFYGGYRFSATPPTDERWASFGAAAFVLPAREVRVDGSGAVLIGRTLSDDADGAGESLRAELRELVEDLAAAAAVLRESADAEGRRLASTGGDAPLRVREGRDVVRRVPEGGRRERFEGAVTDALEEIGRGGLEKVVVARTLEVAVAGGVDPVGLALQMRGSDPEARAFLFEPEPGVAFVGAAPETLFALGGGRFEATAVAGSAPRGDSAEEDERLGRALLESEKDAEEHAIAVREIVSRLEGYVAELGHDPEPRLLRLARIQHLETRIHGRLDDGRTALDVVARLHPTPAVGGVPREAAERFLDEVEGLDRGWYAAPVGWFDMGGNGAFAPALRCALVHDDRCLLYAGAGVVRGSEPASEWRETEVKLLSVLRALEQAAPA